MKYVFIFLTITSCSAMQQSTRLPREVIVVNVEAPRQEPQTPPATKIKVACIGATAAIVSSIITAAITLSITLTRCNP